MPIRVCHLLVLAVMLVGCARVSTGVQPVGATDTYVITERDSPVSGGARAAERMAMAEANKHCHSLGQSFIPVAAQVLGRPWQRALVGDTGVRLTFRCQVTDALDDASSWSEPYFE